MTTGQQYLVIDLDPFSIAERLKNVEGPLSSFQAATANMLFGAMYLSTDPTYWVSEEARPVLKRNVMAREVLGWLWGMSAPTPDEQMALIRHVGTRLGDRFENYKAVHVALPTFAKATVPESVSLRAAPAPAVPKGAFSGGDVAVQDVPTPAAASVIVSEITVIRDPVVDGPLVQIRKKPQS